MLKSQLLVTGLCNLKCVHCNMATHRQRLGDYQMSMDEVRRIIEATKESGYNPLREIVINGGEPTLWRHLEEAVELLQASGIANSLQVFTNGANPKRITKRLTDAVSYVRVSVYKTNHRQCLELQQRFGDKVKLVNRERFYLQPTKFLGPAVIPANCLGGSDIFCQEKVYACGCGFATLLRLGLAEADYPELQTFLAPHYRDRLKGFCRDYHQLCEACSANIKTRHVESSVPNCP